jgi:hypothetical protein
MTSEDRVYADWLNAFGSDEITDTTPDVVNPLHRMHDAAEASHDPLCVCTHPLSAHNLNRLCIALPGVTGCGCLGFLEADRG